MHMISPAPPQPLPLGLGTPGYTDADRLPFHMLQAKLHSDKDLNSPVRRERVWLLTWVAVPLFFDVNLLTDRGQLKDAEIADGAQHDVVATLQGERGSFPSSSSLAMAPVHAPSPQEGTWCGLWGLR